MSSPSPVFKKQKIIVLAGPTGVGKTELSLGLAKRFKAEIISMDSMQIYKYMDIGTAKPTVSERATVPHHLVDYVEPDEDYHVNRFVEDARHAIKDIVHRGYLPMLVGGTGLYMRSLLEGVFEMPEIPSAIRSQVRKELANKGNAQLYKELFTCDPETAARIHENDSQRLARGIEIFRATGKSWTEHQANQQRSHDEFKAVRIGLERDREELYQRINHRVDIMMELGLLAEVQGLLDRGFGADLSPMQSIGYRHMVNYINGSWTMEEALRLLARDTRHYAKRQFTWFGRDKDINWFHPNDYQNIEKLLEQEGF